MAINILVIDDSIVTRMMISRTLRLTQVPIGQLYEAENGREGIKQMLTNSVDVVIADLNMPVMNGLEMLEIKNQDEYLRTIPVIVVSTEGSNSRRDELDALGVNAFIRKPFTPEGIRDAIAEVLGEPDDEANQSCA
jgi:two-component system, chemotaxis family, chemotaxis protein CheY